MATHQHEKPSVAHIESLDASANTLNQDAQSHDDANEEIVRHLQNTGEDVGMTCKYTKHILQQ